MVIGKYDIDEDLVRLFAPVLERWVSLEKTPNNVKVLEEMTLFFNAAVKIDDIKKLKGIPV